MTAIEEWKTNPIILGRELRLVGDAKSAVTQCCLALGNVRTSQILNQLSDVEDELRDRIDILQGLK